MNIVITDYGFPSVSKEEQIITAQGHQLFAYRNFEEALASGRLHDADALMVQWAPITRAVIHSLRQCKVIVRYGIGVDNVDLAAAKDHNISVCNVPDYCIDEVADHAFALAMALHRQLPQTDAAVRAGTWKITPPARVRACRETLFVALGFGRIAQATLARAKAFGFKVAAFDPYIMEEMMMKAGVMKLTLQDALAQADIVSLHAPLTEETRHVINEHSIGTMKPSVIVVNTSRGKLIDTIAAANALCAGKLGGIGLDVFEEEPLPEQHPLRTSPNTLLTSHTAWYSESSIPLLQKLAAEEVVRGLRGEALRNRVV